MPLYHPALAGYHPALAGTPPEEGNWNHLGGLFQTCLRQAGAVLPLTSFRRRPACMDAGGRAAFGTKAEEFSG